MEREPKPQFEIRTATVDDTGAIRRMHAASWLATYPNDEHGVSYEWVKEYTDAWFTPEQMARSRGYVQETINDPEGFYRVAESNGEVVGFVHAANNKDGTKELEAIYVHPEMFGAGLGHELMVCAQEWAGSIQMSLEVAVYNERAIRFYEKHGFEKVEGSEYLYKDKIPVMKMVRKGDDDEI